MWLYKTSSNFIDLLKDNQMYSLKKDLFCVNVPQLWEWGGRGEKWGKRWGNHN